MNISIAGTGCSLMDRLYTGVDFSGAGFQKYISREKGDGGLTPGKLVFTEEFEQFAGVPYSRAVEEIVGLRGPDSYNIGGPAIVPLIHAAQLHPEPRVSVHFYGALGEDATADKILAVIRKTPVDTRGYRKTGGVSPFTDVFSDPNWDNGNGERAFINHIGAAWNCTPESLDNAFWKGDIILFGGTALVPNIHDNLTELTRRCRETDKITLVATVFDFRNEKKDPYGRWPLGRSEETFRNTDLLIVDREEAFRISGTDKIEDSMLFFREMGTDACIITQGAEPVWLYSSGGLFKPQSILSLPISEAVGTELRSNPESRGDTTGCGDNFAGGVIASIAEQLFQEPKGRLDIIEACTVGIVSGGFTCFYAGGTYIESRSGEKLDGLKPLLESYRKQIGR